MAKNATACLHYYGLSNMSDMEEVFNAQQTAEKCSEILHSSDYCAKTLGIKIECITPGEAKLTMRVDKAYANGYGMCQGGIVTALADTAFAHACNSYNKVTVAQGLSIEFVRPAKIDEVLSAHAIEQSRGKHTGVYQVEVRNPLNKLVAIMTGKSFASDKTLFDN